MSNLTQRDSEVIKWLLREADARDAREPRPTRSIDPVIWALVAILTALAIAAIGGWFRIF